VHLLPPLFSGEGREEREGGRDGGRERERLVYSLSSGDYYTQGAGMKLLK